MQSSKPQPPFDIHRLQQLARKCCLNGRKWTRERRDAREKRCHEIEEESVQEETEARRKRQQKNGNWMDEGTDVEERMGKDGWGGTDGEGRMSRDGWEGQMGGEGFLTSIVRTRYGAIDVVADKTESFIIHGNLVVL